MAVNGDVHVNGISNFEIKTLHANILDSSTKTHLSELHILHERISELSNKDRAAALRVLLGTYSFYVDRISRKAVQDCLRALCDNNLDEHLPELVNFLNIETLKSTLAPGSLFVLVEWCSLLLQELARHSAGDPAKLSNLWEKWGLKVLLPQAQILEKCMATKTRSAKDTRKHSALVVTRRGLRAVFQIHDAAADLAITALTAKAQSSAAGNSLLLGVIAGVVRRLRLQHHTKQTSVVERRASDYYAFYTREIVGTRTVLPSHTADGLHDFFNSYATTDGLMREVFPAIEKALLRAPEVVLNGLITPFIHSLPSGLDLSEALKKHLLKPLLSNIKSTNATVREGSLFVFEAVMSLCKDEQLLSEVIDEVINTLKDAKSADHRTLYACMLAAIPSSPMLADKLVSGVCAIALKETNEVTLSGLLKVLVQQSKYSFSSITANGALADMKENEHNSGHSNLGTIMMKAFAAGLSDKKPAVRRAWAVCFGDIVWALPQAAITQPTVSAFIEAVLHKIAIIWHELLSAVIAAAQSGLITIAYITVALCILRLKQTDITSLGSVIKKLKIESFLASADGKTSVLLNHRIYTRLTTEVDHRWYLRALEAAASPLSDFKDISTTPTDWGQAVIYMTSSTSVQPTVRREASEVLRRAYLKRPEYIGNTVIEGLWRWLRNLDLDEKDTPANAAKSGRQYLNLSVHAICPSAAESEVVGAQVAITILKQQLIRLLVMCRSPLVPRVRWIDLCLHTGIDPKVLVDDTAERCLAQIVESSNRSTDHHAQLVHQAACDAAAELAFISPNTVTPILVELITNELNATQLQGIGPTEAAIFRTPEGVAFLDVQADKRGIDVPDKNVKDYETLKWEQELRAQLAQKQGRQKKLTAEGQAKVTAQLAKEATIRQQVASVEIKLRRGIGIIDSLARGPPTDTEAWIGPSIQALYQAIEAGAAVLVGNAAAVAYLACSALVSPRLGMLRTFIGVATLRAQMKSQLSQEMESEPLEDLVTRVLYRIRFSAEQRPFDITSLSYMLPLINVVLVKGGIVNSAGEVADEQITLALEFLSFHTDLCRKPENIFDEAARADFQTVSSVRLPRREVSALLINLMQKYNQHYKLLKDCLLNLCHAISPNITDAEVAVFLRGVIATEVSVRTSSLQAIDNDLELQPGTFVVEIWLGCYDESDENTELAETIWEENSLQTKSDSCFDIIPYLMAQDAQLRRSAARALAACLKNHIGRFKDVLANLQHIYIEKAKVRLPERDAYGMPRKTDVADSWEARHGIALAFKELAALFPEDLLVDFIEFLIKLGPLADRHSLVREQMVDASSSLISVRGASKVEDLMKILEDTLAAPNSGSKDYDEVNEAVIIMYGALARHLKTDDERIPKVVHRLLTTLNTPSEAVQFAIASCLPPLVRNSAASASEYVQKVMGDLLESKKYAGRRGAAYGLAGIISGKGVSTLREHRIMSSLRSAVEDKKEQNRRQGAFLAYELLSTILGQLFEPYVVQIVPQLLAGFGDSSADVRDACLDAAKACFANLSSFGVKKVLPTLLEGLNEQQWRSKKGACDSLGAMAYLDPQQLAASLPEIIPPLTNVLNDSHKEVRASANRSLQRFGEVISNPEIKSLVSILLKALSDPTKYTDDALDALLKISFTHYLDAPSLALVVRILERGLGDRSATKRKGSQIIGSLAHLTERKDLVSHLPILVSGLRVAAVDPVPATRATASKALGSLVEKLGEDALPDLIPSLMSALKADTGAGDRLGSAQALSEVLAGLGVGRLEETLPSILQNVTSAKASVREGFMSLFIFLPACFGNNFANYLSRVIPPILSGLADDVESIRETSLRAGRLLVKNFATRAIDLLLPELQRGLADDNHRIRLSSVELVGDLLFNLTGISTKTEEVEVEEKATAAGLSLLEVLGEEKRNNILSALYISRCDTSGLVRNAAIDVWKALVASPRTLREITPTLTQVLIRRLASSNPEQKVIAGNALGELIRKAGEGVLASLLPTLEEGLQTSVDADSKQGICIALRELMTSAMPDSLDIYESKLVSVVQTAVVDPNEDVRQAAAEAFDAMQHLFGKRVIDRILPNLLVLLQDESEAENALAALLTLLTNNTRSNIILPNLLPTLLISPISAFNARALACLASVAGSTMTRKLSNILNSLLDNIISCKDADRLRDLDDAFDAVLLSVDEFDGLNTCMSIMLGLVKHEDHRRRASANQHLANFFTKTDLDYSRYYADLIRALLVSFDDRDNDVVKAAWEALTALTSRLQKEEMESLVVSTRQALNQAGVAGHELPGFLLPKGISAVLPIFLQGLINGTVEQRIQSSMAISEIIDKTGADSLKPYVTQITGPLIRVVSEKSVEVKAAIVLTLNHLLEKIPSFLRPFLPQLQRTFTKALADTSSEVLRGRAAKALGTLITMTPRIDPLIGELVTGAKTHDPDVKNTMQKALYEVVSKVGANMSEASRASVIALIDEDDSESDSSMAITNARLLGALIKNLPSEAAAGLVKSRVLLTHPSKSSMLALNAILLDSPLTLTQPYGSETVSAICRGIGSQNSVIIENAVLAAGKYLLTDSSSKSFDVTKILLEALLPILQSGSPLDARRLALVVIRTVSRNAPDLVRPHLGILAPPVLAGGRDMVIPIKLSSEAAFLALFCVVDEENAVFDKYMAGPGASLPQGPKRAMQDYFKRVATRLAAQARERKEAEGGQGGLGLSNDEKEDEREVWSVGKVDLGESAFDE